jgi:hypothetical protein
MGKRLKQFIDYKNISLNAFDKSIGASNGYIGKQIKNEASIGSEMLATISEAYPELNLYWLVSGEGEMLKNVQSSFPTIEDTQTIKIDGTISLLKEMIKEKEIEIKELNREIGELTAQIKSIKSEM